VNGPWQWDDTPRRPGSTPRRDRSYPSPSPAGHFIPASPAESRLPSPWEGGDSPYQGTILKLLRSALLRGHLSVKI